MTDERKLHVCITCLQPATEPCIGQLTGAPMRSKHHIGANPAQMMVSQSWLDAARERKEALEAEREQHVLEGDPTTSRRGFVHVGSEETQRQRAYWAAHKLWRKGKGPKPKSVQRPAHRKGELTVSELTRIARDEPHKLRR